MTSCLSIYLSIYNTYIYLWLKKLSYFCSANPSEIYFTHVHTIFSLYVYNCSKSSIDIPTTCAFMYCYGCKTACIVSLQKKTKKVQKGFLSINHSLVELSKDSSNALSACSCRLSVCSADGVCACHEPYFLKGFQHTINDNGENNSCIMMNKIIQVLWPVGASQVERPLQK